MTDRRYGVNKYGDGKLYGPSDTRQGLAWDVSIDWDEDGIFDANEASRLIGYSFTRGRTRLLQDAGAGFEAVATGSLTITLSNSDGRFDGWNSASPLYPNVSDGKDLRLRVKDLASGIIYPRFRGVITNIVPADYGEDAKVMIHCSDGLIYLRNYTARVAIQAAITPDAAIGMILDDVRWPSKWGRSLDVSTETIQYWWATGDKKAMDETEDLANSFLGYFFVDHDGQARFVKRSNVTAPVAAFEQATLLKDIGNEQPFAIRRNIMRLKVHPRKQAATSTIYQWVGAPPLVSTGAVNALRLFCNYTYSGQAVPAQNVTISLFQANTQADFLGTDKTADCTDVLTNFGQTGLVVITNNSGGDVYIKLELEGDAIYEPNSSDITYPKDVTTIKNPRELVLDLLWQQDINVATDIANAMGPFFADPHPMPYVQVDDRPSLQYAPDLFDIVSADISKLGLNGVSFRVGGIEEHTDTQFEDCQRVITQFYLEAYISANSYMQWDANSVWDTSTIFGW